MPIYLEAISRLAELTRGEVAVRAPGTGPFSLASHLMGTEQFLVELALAEREPDGPAEHSLKHLLVAYSYRHLEECVARIEDGENLPAGAPTSQSPVAR
jgi:uroporphyrinogen decarboxylase